MYPLCTNIYFCVGTIPLVIDVLILILSDVENAIIAKFWHSVRFFLYLPELTAKNLHTFPPVWNMWLSFGLVCSLFPHVGKSKQFAFYKCHFSLGFAARGGHKTGISPIFNHAMQMVKTVEGFQRHFRKMPGLDHVRILKTFPVDQLCYCSTLYSLHIVKRR
jgi:hypothetical protein